MKSKFLPRSKDGQFAYLCAIGNECDPENKKLCDGELVCDTRHEKSVCVPSDSISRKMDKLIFEGKEIIGDSDTIAKLKTILIPDNEREKIIRELISVTGGFPKKYTKKNNKELKKLLEKKKEKKKTLVTLIKRITGGKKKKYNKMNVKQLKQLLKKLKEKEVEVVISDQPVEVDIESALSDIVEGKGFKDMDKVKKAILKCMGLLSN